MARPRKVVVPDKVAVHDEPGVVDTRDFSNSAKLNPAPDTRYAKWRGYTVIRQNLRALLAEAESKGDKALADEAKAALT